MPPKAKKAAAADRAKDVQETEEPLQAVILADSFETRFRPFTFEKPRCLLPLVNVPLIEYTFEFLANSGVEEVFVYCGAHTEQVEEYIQQSKWSKSSSPFTTEIIRSTSSSVGDAMRDLDKRGIMMGDFIIVYGDIVSNLPLGPALAEHRARRAKDKNAIMTMVLREAGTTHRTKAQGASPVFVLDPTKDRCLHYEQISRTEPNKRVELDDQILLGHDEIELRHDLIDCGIDICTPDVLALWSDNFDYEVPRRNFLHSVLKDYELNGKTIHTHITKDYYAARARNLQAYAAVSRDVTSRWSYPMTPDSNLQEGDTYRLRKGHIYQEEGVELAWTSVIGRSTVLGRGTKIGKGSKIVRSVVGRNCKIGENCVVEDSYIWDGAVLEDGAQVRKAIIANGAVVGKGCSVHEGSLVSYGVQIRGEGGIMQGQRIIKAAREEQQTRQSKIVKIVGADGEGYEFEPSDDEDEDTKAGLVGSIYESPAFAISAESISTLHSDIEEEIEIEHHTAPSFLSVASDDLGGAQGEAFVAEATHSIHDALKEGTDVSTIQLELQSLRMSANASEHQVRRAVASALVKHLIEVRDKGAAAMKTVINNNSLLVQRSMFDAEDAEEKRDQVDFLLLVQTELARLGGEKDIEGIMLQVCNELYLGDVLDQEGLEQWYNDGKSQGKESLLAVRTQLDRFMEVLAEESEDDDDDEEDDEDEEEDDE